MRTWCSERRANIRNLGPVESDNGHAQPMDVAKHLVDLDVVRCDPADPREVGEGLEKVAREEV